MLAESKVTNLRQQNQALRLRIAEFRKQQPNAGHIDNEIKKFIDESQKNIIEMTQKVNQQNSQNNSRLHSLTTKYQSILKSQINLLTLNKELTNKKNKQDEVFDENIEKMTAEYENKIKQFEQKVKGNVKKIQNLSGSNIIGRLLSNERFVEEMKKRDVKIEVLKKQSELEDISAAVEEKQIEITEMETESARLDEELMKMRELIDTMKDLLENMVKEKENIVKQNVILKEKLKQSEELIGKLLGASMQGNEEDQNQDDDQNYEEDFDEQDNEANNEAGGGAINKE